MCVKREKCGSLTGLAKLQKFVCVCVFSPLFPGTFCARCWLKGGSFHIEVQQEVVKLDKREDYLAEGLSECSRWVPRGIMESDFYSRTS